MLKRALRLVKINVSGLVFNRCFLGLALDFTTPVYYNRNGPVRIIREWSQYRKELCNS